MSNAPKEPYYVQLGSGDYPLPMRDEAGNPYLLNSNEQVIYFPSWLQPKEFNPGSGDMVSVQDQAMGRLARQLPTGSMLPLFKQELERRDPNRTDQRNRSYVSGLRGSPAVGKSFMYKLLGKISHPRGASVFDCKGVDMGTLFRELVFDMSAAVQETNAIDAKILRGNVTGLGGLNSTNLAVLKSICGEEAFHAEKNGEREIVSIDWSAVKIRNERGEEPETVEEKERLTKKFQESLRQICMSEGLTASENIAKIGLVERDGIAIRACDPNSPDYGRPIMLEDPDQSKPGTMRKLDEWLPVLTGAESSCTVTGSGGRTTTIDRSQFTPSFHVSITQNQAIEGTGSQSLDSPTMSRLSLLMETAPDASKVDWVDRICQQLTGVSGNQFYCAADDLHNDNNLLKDVLLHYRKLGLTQAQIRDLNTLQEEQLQNIKNANKTIQLAENLGSFCNEFSMMINPKSKAYKDRKFTGSQEYETYLIEKAAEFNLRAVTNLFNNAATVTAAPAKNAVDFRSIIGGKKGPAHDGEIADSHLISLDKRLLTRGDRLEAYIMELVKRITIPSDAAARGIDVKEATQVYDNAVKFAAKNQIGLKRTAGKAVGVAELFNLDISDQMRFRASHVRDALIDALKTANPGLKLPKEKDRIISVPNMERAIEALESAKLYTSISTTAIMIPNTDPDTFERMPFKQIMLKDTVPEQLPNVKEEDQPKPFYPWAKDLVMRDTLLSALTIPTISKKIIPNLWNESIATLIVDEEETGIMTQAQLMAQHLPGTDFAITTLMTQIEELPPKEAGGMPRSTQHMHLIRNTKQDKLLIVGGAINPELRKKLESNGIAYLDFTAKDAEATINKALNEMVKGYTKPEEIRNDLRSAFLYRNGREKECGENGKRSLGDLMSNPDRVIPGIPTCVTVTQDLAELTHLEQELQRRSAEKAAQKAAEGKSGNGKNTEKKGRS